MFLAEVQIKAISKGGKGEEFFPTQYPHTASTGSFLPHVP